MDSLQKQIDDLSRRLRTIEGRNASVLTQDIFKDAPDWVKSAAVDADGDAYFYDVDKSKLTKGVLGEYLISVSGGNYKVAGSDYDTTNWLSSAINREVEPKKKNLDHSVFEGMDAKWRFAAVDEDGRCVAYTCSPSRFIGGYGQDRYFIDSSLGDTKKIGDNYDASDWKNSLIERKHKELTDIDLVRAMLDNGKSKVLVVISSSKHTPIGSRPVTFAKKEGDKVVTNNGNTWESVIAINVDGEPLTQKEAGL